MFDFGNFDKRVRGKGVTKTFIAQKLGRNSVIFHDWAKGKSNPSEEDLNIVAECLDCTVSYLRGRTSDPKVHVILADPEKVREHEERQRELQQESTQRLYEAIKKSPASSEESAGAEGMTTAQIVQRYLEDRGFLQGAGELTDSQLEAIGRRIDRDIQFALELVLGSGQDKPDDQLDGGRV